MTRHRPPFSHRGPLRAATSLALALPLLAHAWGAQGHRVTGLVADELLTPAARAGIYRLTGDLNLAAMSTYLDEHRSELEQRIPGSREWHYDDRPVCDPAAPKPAYCHDGNCASVQIERWVRVLASKTASVDDRRFALLVLVHVIGDIHQPLHASDHHDRGGNDIAVRFTLPAGPREVNLHTAWDTDFVRASLPVGDERAAARGLISAAGAGMVRRYQAGTVTAWLQQGYALSQTLTYGQLPGFHCEPAGEAAAPPGASPASSPAPSPAAPSAQGGVPLPRTDLPPAYVDSAEQAIQGQLLKAGARIAVVLNRAFAR